MEKKLLSILFILTLFILNPVEGFGQCPTSVSISADPGATVCAGTEVTFTANPTDGSNLQYQWQINEVDVSGQNSSTFTTNSLTNNQKVRVIVTSTSESGCSITSSEVPVTVNPIRTVTATIAANNSNICPGATVNFTISTQSNIGSASSYEWRVNGTSQGTNNTFSSSSLGAGDLIQLWVDSAVPCTDPVLSNTITITEKPGTPATPSDFTNGDTAVCPGTSQTYTIPIDNTASEYIWTLPLGWSGSSTTNSITVNSGNSGSGNITVKAKNSCGTSEGRNLAVSVKAGTPATPGTISGTPEVCPLTTNLTYSITPVTNADANGYIWSVPAGWTINSGQNSASITVTAGSTGQNGDISVTASNSCGTSADKTLAVTVKPGTPATPGSISGTTEVCPLTTSLTYSITSVTNADANGYTWSVPTGWIINSGQNSASITVTAGSTGQNGDISVTASNSCGTSAYKTLAVTVKPGTPATPGSISGTTEVCPLTTSLTYSITPVTNADTNGYTWSVPTGWTINSGQNSTSIIVTAGNAGQNGNISVTASNSCGTSSDKTLAVTVKPGTPATPESITGTAAVCASETGLTYSVPAVTNATSYNWVLPSGWTIQSGEGTRTITVNAGLGDGDISVTAQSDCGNPSAARALAVNTTNGPPGTPGTITSSLGNNPNICPPLSGVTFTVPNVSGATSYQWTVPTGFQITSGVNTNTITVKVNSSTSYNSPVSVSVQPVNLCGPGPSSTFGGIAIDNYIVTDIGPDQTVCKTLSPLTIQGTVTFGSAKFKPTFTTSGGGSFPNAPSNNISGPFTFTYQPAQADLNAGQVIITFTVPKPNGNNSSCGNGVDEMIIYFRETPTASISAGPTICEGTATDLTITGTPNTTVTYKKGSGTNQTVNLGSGGSAIINTGNLNSTTGFQLVSTIYNSTPTCQASLSASTSVTVTPVPTATILYSGTPFCTSDVSAKTVSLSGTGAYQGGTYAATPAGLTLDPNSGNITPSSSTPGTYTVKYTVPASGGCSTVEVTTQVTITKLPTSSISYSGTPFCQSVSSPQAVTLTGTDAYTGGTFTSTSGLIINSSTGAITPSSSSPGNYTITYTTPAGNECGTTTSTTNVVITETPTPQIAYSATEFCTSESSPQNVTLSGGGNISNGTYSAPSGLTIDSTNGAITPSSSTPGTYTATYTLAPSDGCGEITTTTEVTITQEPSVEISYSGPYCTADSNLKEVNYTNGIGAYENGNFISSPAGLSISADGKINSSASTAGTYTITYTIPASGGCGIKDVTTTVDISEAPEATISYADSPFCNSDSVGKSVSFGDTAGVYENGTFSSSAGLTIDENTGEINPSISTPGTYTVTYTIPAGVGCNEIAVTTDIQVYDAPQITTQPYNVAVCTANSATLEVAASGDNLTYQWYKGTEPGTAINGATSSTLNINNAATADDGFYYVIVSGESSCASEKSEEVTLNVDENIVVNTQPQNQDLCEGSTLDLSIAATTTGGNPQYQWRKDGNPITDGGNISGATTGNLSISNVSHSDAGDYDVVIDGPDGYTCDTGFSAKATISVNPPPTADAGEDFDACSTNTAISLKGTDASVSNYTSLEWTTSNGAGTISNPTDLNATYQLVASDYNKDIEFTLTAIFEVNGNEPCSAAVDTKNITILPLPEIASLSYSGTEFCETDTQTQSPTLTGNYFDTSAGTYSVSPASGLNLDSSTGVITPNGSTHGDYTITYTAPSNGICTEVVTKTFDITIGEKPMAEFTYGEEPFCSDSSNITPTFLNDGVSGKFTSNSGLVFVDPDTGEINVSASTPGTYDVTNTVDYSAQGCAVVTHIASITITEKPVADFSYSNFDYCSNPAVAETITPTMGTGAVKGTFSYTATPTGAVLDLDTATGEIDIQASEEGTYIIKNTVDTEGDGCESVSTDFSITIDKLPIALFTYAGISDDKSFCISSLGATIETSPDTGGTYSISGPSALVTVNSSTGVLSWTAAEAVPGTYTVTYTIPAGTVCDEVAHSETISIDALPVGGVLNFTGVGRVFTTCENAVDSYAAPLVLTGETGEVVEWQYKTATSSTWTIYNSQDNQLSSNEVEDLVNNTSTVIRAIISNGACNTGTFSATAIVSVIPSDIKPSPVEAEPTIVCFGTDISLSSKTGYGESFGKFEGGDFTSAGIKNNGWNFTDPNGNEIPFDANANSGTPIHWHKTQPKWKFETAAINSPYTLTDMWWNPLSDGKQNEHFAITQGAFSSNMDTPAFTLTGMDEAKITFDQAYNLTTGATIRVVLLKNGVEYKELDKITGPASSGNYEGFGSGTPNVNDMSYDLGSYLGEANLKVRFEYTGVRRGDVWAVDNIKVPEGPQGVLLQWFYDDDPTNPNNTLEQIGQDNEEVVKFTPRKIGWNDFEVKTALLLDSNGNACESLDNIERVRVFVFDTYETTVKVIPSGCGSYSATLDASLNGALQGSLDAKLETFDGYEGEWKIVAPVGVNYTLTKQNEDSGLDLINDPNVIFTSDSDADFTITWELKPTAVYPEDYSVVELRGELVENPACPPVSVPVTPDFTDCTTLDFDGLDDYISIDNVFAEAKTYEMWIYPEASTGTIISGSGVEINMSDLPSGVSPNSRWYHIALSGNKLYVDGIDVSKTINTTGTGTTTYIGAKWNNSENKMDSFFSGWIEEVRIWKTDLSVKEIRFMMNQRLQNDANMGVEIPMPVPNGLTFTDLAGYYRLISAVPDPLNLGAPWGVTFDAALMPANGLTPNLANPTIPGRLYNMTTNQENTAPMPYISAKEDQLWATYDTWLRPAVWDAPNSNGINGTTPIDWNIVRTNHNINSGDRDITVLGLKSETVGKLLNITGPGAQNEYNPGQMLRVTHYLLLNGNIDLVGESQLLQDEGSILDEDSDGWLERDQQGKRNSFVYNYWSSPVSAQGAANNALYNVKSVLMDGTTASNPQNITFIYDYWAADGATTSNPITISTYWLWGYSPAEANIYAEWDHILENGTLKTGEGFTMKGTNGNAGINEEQNYTFRGKPHNGDFDLSMAAGQNYLIGNPYPSAMDADEFIRNNLKDVIGGNNGTNVFDGALYFWDHFQEVDHILKEYIGGYATYNLSGGVPAISNDDRVNANNAPGSKYPGQYIPVGQAFLINSSGVNATINVIGGSIHFKNSQRIFKREKPVDDSQFLRPEIIIKTNKQKTQEKTKIRISFKSPVGYHRQILVAAIPSTTNGFDLGYDALLFDDNAEDMYWMQAENQLVIQGVPNFDKDQVLPLGVKIKENKEFRIKIDTVENAPEGMMVYLNDKLNDSIHDLRKSAYSSTSEPGLIHDRFEIIFFKDEPVPPVTEVPGEDPDELKDQFGISIRHGQTDRELQILNPHELSITNMYIFDLNGNKLEGHSDLPGGKEFKMPVRNYSSGIYIVQLVVEGRVVSKKIIINN